MKIIKNLAYMERSRELLTDPRLGVVELLCQAGTDVKGGDDEVPFLARKALAYFSPEQSLAVAANEPSESDTSAGEKEGGGGCIVSFVESAVKRLRSLVRSRPVPPSTTASIQQQKPELQSEMQSEGNSLICEVKRIEKLSRLDAHKEYLGSTGLGLIETLCLLLRQSDRPTAQPESSLVSLLLKVLKNLASADVNKQRMGILEAGVVDMLMAIVTNSIGSQVEKERENQGVALDVLVKLSSFDDSNRRMGSDDKIVCMIREVVEFGRPDFSVVSALKIVCNFASLDEHRYLGSPERGMVGLLMAIVRRGGAQGSAVGAAVCAEDDQDNSTSSYQGREQSRQQGSADCTTKNGTEVTHLALGVASISISCGCPIENTFSDATRAPVYSQRAQMWALGILYNLAFADENMKYMLTPEVGLVELLTETLEHTSGRTRLWTLRNLFYLAYGNATSPWRDLQDCRLLNALMAIVREGPGKGRVWAIKTLGKLAHADSSREFLSNADLGLVALMKDVAGHDTGRARSESIETLRKLAYQISPERMAEMGSPEGGLLELMLAIARDGDDEARTSALRVLQLFAYEDEYREKLGDFEFGLTEVLKEIILSALSNSHSHSQSYAVRGSEQGSSSAAPLPMAFDESVGISVAIFRYLICNDSNGATMGLPERGYVPLILAIARRSSGSVRSDALDSLVDVSFSELHGAYLASPQLGYVAYLMEQLVAETSAETLVSMLRSIYYLCNNPVMMELLCDDPEQEGSLWSTELGLIELVMHMVDVSTGSVLEEAVDIIGLLYSVEEVGDTERIGGLTEAILALLMQVVRLPDSGPRIAALRVLTNCCYIHAHRQHVLPHLAELREAVGFVLGGDSDVAVQAAAGELSHFLDQMESEAQEDCDY